MKVDSKIYFIPFSPNMATVQCVEMRAITPEICNQPSGAAQDRAGAVMSGAQKRSSLKYPNISLLAIIARHCPRRTLQLCPGQREPRSPVWQPDQQSHSDTTASTLSCQLNIIQTVELEVCAKKSSCPRMDIDVYVGLPSGAP